MIDPSVGADQRDLIQALDRFSAKTDALLRGGTNQTITLSGGGFGLWVAITCCLVMLAVMAIAVPIGVGAYLSTQAEIKQLQNTDNAIRAYINTGKMPPAPKDK